MAKEYTPGPKVREKMDEFLTLYLEDRECRGNIAGAIRKIDVPRQHFYERWMHNTEFAQQFEDAKAELGGAVRATLLRKALVDEDVRTLLQMDRILNREDYQKESTGTTTPQLSIIINTPGVVAGPQEKALPEPDVIPLEEAEGRFVMKPVEYIASGDLNMGDDWDGSDLDDIESEQS